MNLLYLTTWDFSKEECDGVCKKIRAQIKAFEMNDLIVDLIYIRNGYVIYLENGYEKKIFAVGVVRKTPAYMKLYNFIKNKEYDWIYNRYGMMDSFYYRVLKRLKKNGAKILIEIPTYPYRGEKPEGFLYWCMFKWDDIYVKWLKGVVDRIITYSDDTEIFNIPTLHIINGMDIEEIEMISDKQPLNDTIDLLIVAVMQKHHGYERLLNGLRAYLDKGGSRKILCHFIGDGPEKKYYIKMAENLSLESHVVFYGMKSGQALDRIYEIADIGITALGLYKDGVYLSSELKSREYLAKGLPVLSGCPVDVLHGRNLNFYLEMPNDDTMIDMDELIAFYDRLYRQGRKKLRQEIRKYSEENVDIKNTMRTVISYIREN